MKQKIIKALKKLLWWIKFLFWDKPTSKPPKEKPIRVKAEEVLKEYMVVHYHEQRINMRITEYPLWKALPRKDKRAMALRFKVMEKKGHIRFEEINGKLICIKNKDYEGIAETQNQK